MKSFFDKKRKGGRIMYIEKYPDFESAVRAVTSPERKYVFERHELVAGENISWHFHSEAQEIIIIQEGAFLLAVEKESKIIRRKKRKEVEVVQIYPGEAHTLLAISDVFYAVYKTQEDKVVRCGGLDLKVELEKMLLIAKQVIRDNLQKGG